MTLIERFLGQVEKRSDGHWIWKGYVSKSSGRGVFRFGGKNVPRMSSSRAAWAVLKGPIPAGSIVLHRVSCNLAACVNPDHLYLGTYSDNTKDAVSTGRQPIGDKHPARVHPERMARGERNGAHTHPERRPRGERHGQAKLTAIQVHEVFALRKQGLLQREIAAKFGVHQRTVWRILSGKGWTK